MKRYHIIIDFQYLYYRHYFGVRDGRSRRLSYNVNGEDIDTTYLYYCMKDIESFRSDTLKMGDGDVTVSICFDSKSERKEENTDYKSGRTNNLDNTDFDNIAKIKELASTIGYNVYKEEGKEADDLVFSLAKDYKDDYDLTIIYTIDKDLVVNVNNKVGVMRYKTNKGSHFPIHINNYESYLSSEFKCRVPYNSILLLLCTVGDASDKVKGIQGFGPKAFDKLIDHLDEINFDFRSLDLAENVEKLLRENESFLVTKKNPNALREALDSLEMVKTRYVEGLIKPIKSDTDEKRKEQYLKYGMVSLTR